MLKKVGMIAVFAVLSACGGGGENTVGPGGVASVALNAPSLSMLPGLSDQLTAVAKDAQGNTIATAPAATWTTSNSAVASVNATGLVTANAVGSASITATISGKSASAQVTVAAAATVVTVNMPGLSFTPFRATLKQGGTVNYVFPSLAHNVIFERVQGAPADIPGQVANQTISRQFNSVRLFKYTCTLHNGMDGEVDVVP
ncbi:MAG: Ig-like domain-containing protein [Gemmatimonadaceae bacterium]|nr:Ig-like domain-containing protein [Gemmatimonadota bacterium]MCC7324917.1 Ig-like domain-containing protein [Gemmatimonadaceae bacterium]